MCNNLPHIGSIIKVGRVDASLIFSGPFCMFHLELCSPVTVRTSIVDFPVYTFTPWGPHENCRDFSFYHHAHFAFFFADFAYLERRAVILWTWQIMALPGELETKHDIEHGNTILFSAILDVVNDHLHRHSLDGQRVSVGDTICIEVSEGYSCSKGDSNRRRNYFNVLFIF
jgi:hypothetical protein